VEERRDGIGISRNFEIEGISGLTRGQFFEPAIRALSGPIGIAIEDVRECARLAQRRDQLRPDVDIPVVAEHNRDLRAGGAEQACDVVGLVTMAIGLHTIVETTLGWRPSRLHSLTFRPALTGLNRLGVRLTVHFERLLNPWVSPFV
jgi:hypothetical protein